MDKKKKAAKKAAPKKKVAKKTAVKKTAKKKVAKMPSKTIPFNKSHFAVITMPYDCGIATGEGSTELRELIFNHVKDCLKKREYENAGNAIALLRIWDLGET
jgi:hypothetical protein